MNKNITSKEKILEAGCDLVRKEGWSAMNIRRVAALCGVSVGSIYNYFDSKAEFVKDVVGSIWREIFHLPESSKEKLDALGTVKRLYRCMEIGNRRYPGFFSLHSLGFEGMERLGGKMRMLEEWEHILHVLIAAFERDPNVRPDAFTEEFTPEMFANLLLSFLIAAVVRGNYDAKPVIELVRRMLYENPR